MKKDTQKHLRTAAALLMAFVLWTAALGVVDRQAIGPQGSSVGFATFNRFVHERIGVNLSLYRLTDALSLLPLGCAAGFALLGLGQWMQRKRLGAVDADILALGGFYLTVIAVYCFFERVVINFRPVLIEGRLEASYPSSTTVLVLCVTGTATMQLRKRLKSRPLARFAQVAAAVFAWLMVLGRLASGVHWATDLIGGALFALGLVKLYGAVSGLGGARRD